MENLYIDNIEKQYIDIFLISATNWINVNPWVSADVQINLQTDLTKSSATSVGSISRASASKSGGRGFNPWPRHTKRR